MKVKMLACCEKTILDIETNRASCINIIDSIESKSFPILISSFNVLSIFDKEKGDGDEIFYTLFLNLNDSEILSRSLSVDFSDVSVGVRSLVEINNFVIPVNGDLVIQLIDYSGSLLSSWHIKVERETQSQV
ncbi:hypothetical protein [Komagataeibacter diospyri]|uniref:hypothetical protein n=1 Tax=Komagataeibacter diospyri TaxID=1932662 RepID=UPI003758232B